MDLVVECFPSQDVYFWVSAPVYLLWNLLVHDLLIVEIGGILVQLTKLIEFQSLPSKDFRFRHDEHHP